MSHPVMFSEDDPGLSRLRELCLSFPGAEEFVSHGRPNFRTKKIFASFGGSEKLRPGEHRQVPSACMIKVDPSELPALDEDDRFFVPSYVGPYGWRATDLAQPEVDWDEVAELVDASYRLTAPKALVKKLDARH
ncbi:MAG: MmcQ/YjbR family DNA-binding protein [Nocardioides sp.]|nr:MmcQ/YjbR family DNA-binding protein [Nocardioides sp.]